MTPDKVWVFQDQGGFHRLTEREILATYFDFWSGEMRTAGHEDGISEDHCIEDFVTVHWAWAEPTLGGLCQVPHPTREARVYCTRPKGHDGPHIATIGPYAPGVVELARWL